MPPTRQMFMRRAPSRVPHRGALPPTDERPVPPAELLDREVDVERPERVHVDLARDRQAPREHGPERDHEPDVALGRIRGRHELALQPGEIAAVSYTHLRAHETPEHLVC